jgi:hypothetical protein
MAPTKDRLHFEWFGPWPAFLKDTGKKVNEIDCGIRVWATMKGEDSPRILEVEMNQATVRNSPLWKSDPKQQLAYLATKNWARLYCPDVIMGVYTPEDLSSREEIDITPAGSVEEMLESRPEPEITGIEARIQNYLDSIAGAQNMNRLLTIGNQIKAAEQAIQEAVRDVYMAKQAELKPPKKEDKVDINTGEISNAKSPALMFDLAGVMKAMEMSGANADKLDEACDLIRELPQKDQSAARKFAAECRKKLPTRQPRF